MAALSISRSAVAYDKDYTGHMRSGGASIGRVNVESIEEFLLGEGGHVVDHNAGGSITRIFHTGAGNDDLTNRGGYVVMYAGGGDDVANMMEGGTFYGQGGNDFVRFSDTGTDNAAFGGKGDDAIVLHRFKGSVVNGGRGFDSLSFESNNSANIVVDLAAKSALGIGVSNGFQQTQIDTRVVGFEQVIGTERGDSIFGAKRDEKLIGFDGNDVIDGRRGDDQLFGGTGNDRLTGGKNDDRLHGGLGDDILMGGAGRDTAIYSYSAPDGPEGAVAASGFGGVVVDLLAGTASGSFGNDTLAGIEDVFGSGGNDTLSGDDRRNVLSGEAGDDNLFGRGGNDLLILGRGTDTADGGDGDDRIVVGAGNSTVKGGAGDDALVLGPENGRVTVDFASSSYAGTLRINQAVWLDDGTIDARDYDGSLLTPDQVKQASALYADDAGDLVRQLPEAGDPLADQFSITEKKMAEAVSGTFSGIETIVGGGSRVNLLLSGGVDSYDGTNSRHDFIDFRASGTGVNYELGAGNDMLVGIEGVLGSHGDDMLTGDGARNILSGLRGDDTLRGLDGNDLIRGVNGHDNMIGGKGSDRILGGNGRDKLRGSGGDDKLSGDGGRDRVIGGAGDDKLFGGKGNDRLIGGKGQDEFHFRKGDGFDRALDFKDGVDALDLSSWGFTSVDAALNRATDTADGVLFEFGSGDMLLVANNQKAALADDILI